jgi:hypothetical protein
MGLLMALPISKHKSSPNGIPETRGYIKFAFTACTHSKNKLQLNLHLQMNSTHVGDVLSRQ